MNYSGSQRPAPIIIRPNRETISTTQLTFVQDLHIMPILVFIYFTQFLDKNILSYSSIMYVPLFVRAHMDRPVNSLIGVFP